MDLQLPNKLVFLDGVASQPFQIFIGVNQGAVLSSSLFLILINDLLSYTQNPIHNFTDDSTFHSSNDSSKSHSLNDIFAS